MILRADATAPETIARVRAEFGLVPLIVADPPYGRIVREAWDGADDETSFSSWMLAWVVAWSELLVPGGAFYIWGGIGKPCFRPLFRFLAEIEKASELTLSNLITWRKRRAYGTQTNYLFTREECAYLVKGDPRAPHRFNIPYLDKKRGYPGYNPKYPAKSEYLRRSNVWEETEILAGKLHPTQKADRVSEIPIEVHTNPADVVVDLLAGSGSTSAAALRLGRRFVAVENDEASVVVLENRLAR